MNEPVITVRAQDLGDVALRLIGLDFLYSGVMFMPFSSMTAVLQEDSYLRLLGATLRGVAYVALGVYLIRWSAKLSKKLFGSVGAVGLPLPIAAELQAVAFRVLGVYILVGSLPTFLGLLVETVNEDFRSGGASLLATFGTQVAFGVVLLLFRSTWVSRLWKQPPPPTSQTSPQGTLSSTPP